MSLSNYCQEYILVFNRYPTLFFAGNNLVDFDEFVLLMQTRNVPSSEDSEMRAYFKVLDKGKVFNPILTGTYNGTVNTAICVLLVNY